MEKGVVQLRGRVQEVVDVTDWDQFKSEKVLVPSIELKALLLNALKKADRIIAAIMADTIKDKE